MPIDNAPPPPPIERSAQSKSAPIVDQRAKFARRTPQTAEDAAATRAFIEGKIEMVRRDPNMTDAQKAAAIAELEAKR